jgi:hypothetical protein
LVVFSGIEGKWFFRERKTLSAQEDRNGLKGKNNAPVIPSNPVICCHGFNSNSVDNLQVFPGKGF